MHRILSGLSTGEGLIWRVRDPQAEKRLLVFQPELASVFRVMERQGNNLSAIVRQAWDTGNLRVLTKKAKNEATNAHISIIGHITLPELRRYMDRTEIANGFANRFLWACVKRSKLLPEGGTIDTAVLDSFIQELGQVVAAATTVGELTRDREARELWGQVYEPLTKGIPGLLGSATSRADPQTMRLATLYALLDRSDVIRRIHLEAALELWGYCFDSARYIFGEGLGDPAADEILHALRGNPNGLTRTEIRNLFYRHRSSVQIGMALAALRNAGLARMEMQKTGGRPVERWFLVDRSTKTP